MSDSEASTELRLPDARGKSDGPTAIWTFWPLRDQPRFAGTLAVAMFLLGLVVYLLTAKIHLAVLAGMIGTLSVWRIFVPVKYEMNLAGVTQKALGRTHIIEWRKIRSLRLLDDGLLLLPTERSDKLAGLRGIHIPWSDRKDDVLACMEFYAPYLMPDKDKVEATEASTT